MQALNNISGELSSGGQVALQAVARGPTLGHVCQRSGRPHGDGRQRIVDHGAGRLVASVYFAKQPRRFPRPARSTHRRQSARPTSRLSPHAAGRQLPNGGRKQNQPHGRPAAQTAQLVGVRLDELAPRCSTPTRLAASHKRIVRDRQRPAPCRPRASEPNRGRPLHRPVRLARPSLCRPDRKPAPGCSQRADAVDRFDPIQHLLAGHELHVGPVQVRHLGRPEVRFWHKRFGQRRTAGAAIGEMKRGRQRLAIARTRVHSACPVDLPIADQTAARRSRA